MVALLASSRRGEPLSDPREAPLDPRVVWLALAVSTLAAAALRLSFLNHQSFWFDEIYTRNVIAARTLAGLWHNVKATESTPPLYYLIAWLCGGRSAAAMRAIPAVALTVAVPVSYLAFRRLAGQRAALATAAILAVSPILVSYATDARAYGLLVLTAVLSVWGFSAVLEHGSPRRLALWGLACIACVWTHYFGIFLVAGEALVLLALQPQSRRGALWCSALIAICIAPLLALALSQAGDERSAFIAGMPLSTRLEQTVRQFAMGPNVPRTWLEAAGLVLACAAVAVGSVVAVRGRRGSHVLLTLLAAAFLVPLMLGALSIEDRFYSRNVVAALPLVAALAAPALLRLRAVPLAGYVVLATLSSVWVATDWRYEQTDWRGALQRAAAIDRNAAVVAVTKYSGNVAGTYWGEPAAHHAVLIRDAWIVVEPLRPPGHRDLRPAGIPPTVAGALRGFSPTRLQTVHAFRLILVTSHRPRMIDPRRLAPLAEVFPG